MSIGDVYKLQLDKIVSGGEALGKYEGKPVFVQGGAPNETIACRIIEEHNTWARAELLEILNPSPVRCDCICEFYGKCEQKVQCGGCNLAHINYDAQLEIKSAILKDSLLRCKVQFPEPEIFSSSPWGYRNRMQFHCLRQQAKGLDGIKYGLKGRRSGEIITVSDCHIAVQGIRDVLRCAAKGGDGFPLPVEKDRFNVFSKDDVLLSEGGKQKGKIKLLEKEIFIDASLFFQSNCEMLEKLILELRKIANNTNKDMPMADLYCGVGTFALFLSDLFPKIVLAEENKASVSLARENLRQAANIDFFALRDTEWYKAGNEKKVLLHQKEPFGFIIADPPRAGLNSKLSFALAQEKTPVLIYVSCEAASLARDSKVLTDGGYTLNKLLMFDFYPQTAHIESIAVFVK
ncbi:MAG: methyltransferase [Treponema sp.]|nr:methyltransferase [Treponema sp.]